MGLLRWIIIFWILGKLDAPSVIWLLVVVTTVWDFVKTIYDN